jgi:hypothetical protein
MNNEERSRILRMVSEGTISPEEATGLLEALEPEEERQLSPRPMGSIMEHAVVARRRPRTLAIEIHDGTETHVNIRIPLTLARAAGKFIPREAQNRLEEYGLTLDQFIDDLGPGGGDGAIIEIHDHDEHVRIAVD